MKKTKKLPATLKVVKGMKAKPHTLKKTKAPKGIKKMK